MAFKGHTDLEYTEPQQDHAHGPDQGKDEVAQIGDNRQRIAAASSVGGSNHSSQH